MDILTQKERAEKENRELIEKLNEENAKLTVELSKVQKEDVKRETEGTRSPPEKLFLPLCLVQLHKHKGRDSLKHIPYIQLPGVLCL